MFAPEALPRLARKFTSFINEAIALSNYPENTTVAIKDPRIDKRKKKYKI